MSARYRRRVVRVLCSVSALLLLLTGCGHGGPNANPHNGSATASVVNGVQVVTVEATDSYRFEPSTITVHRGQVRIVLKNVGKGAPHNWTLTGIPGAFVPLTSAGFSGEVTFTAPAPGRYQFVCTIHTRQGQTGTLIVLP